MDYIVSTLLLLNESFWFYLPVFVANMMIYAVFSVLKLDIPLDLYHKIKKERIIGHSRNISGFYYYTSITLLIGIILNRGLEALYLGVGGVIGCYASSFIKRRLNIQRGQYAFFIDQTDFILGSSLFYISHFKLPLEIFLSGLVLAMILHHSVNLLRNGWEKLISNYVR